MATGTLVLRLRNFEGQIIRNVSTELQLWITRPNIGRSDTQRHTRDFHTGKENFDLQSPPLAAWNCDVTAERYEIRNTGFFRPKGGQSIEREIWLPRNVREKWEPQFVLWNNLNGRFSPLRKLLENSPNLRLRIKNEETSRLLGQFTEASYDDVDDDRQLIMGKAGLLNIYAKLMSTQVPGVPGVPWLTGIQELLGIQRDRIVGVVSPKMAKTVKQIHENRSAFPNYVKAPVGQHFENNIKPLIPNNFSSKVEAKYSIKTREKIGVLQLVIARVSGNGQTSYIMDADIDENGNLLKHFGDFIKHKFTAGTHPFHVYDILHRTINTRLAYELV